MQNSYEEQNIGAALSEKTDELIEQQTVVYTPRERSELAPIKIYSTEEVQICVVVEGSGAHKVLGNEIPCKAGDIYIINSNVPHGYAADADSSLTVRRLSFYPQAWMQREYADPSNAKFCHGVFSENGSIAYAMLTEGVLEKVISLCDAIAIEQHEEAFGWREAVLSHLSLILVTLARYINRAIKNLPRISTSVECAVSGIVAAIEENYTDPSITLDTYAKMFYTNKSSLSRSFKQITGEYFSDYLRRVRLGKACELLIDTDMTVNAIMRGCGMQDATSFYKAFSAFAGMTPKEYRKKHKADEMAKNILLEISEKLQRGKSNAVKELVAVAIAEGIDANTILTDGLLSGMNVIGERFKNNEIYVPEVLIAARAMNMGTQLLKPYLYKETRRAKGRVCIGTVQGDLHDIGKNLVKMMMEGKGLEVIDLGTDVSPEVFVKTAVEKSCDVICCSALLTTTIGVMADVVRAAEAAGIREKIKIMIGGAPISEEFCKEIGADCYTADAASAAEAAVKLCSEGQT